MRCMQREPPESDKSGDARKVYGGHGERYYRARGKMRLVQRVNWFDPNDWLRAAEDGGFIACGTDSKTPRRMKWELSVSGVLTSNLHHEADAESRK